MNINPSSAIRTAVVGVAFASTLIACGGGSSAESGGGGPSVATCSPRTIPAAAPGSVAAVVDAAVGDVIAAQDLPGISVSVAKQGSVLYEQGYGYASLESCAPTQAGTVYQIGSVTKQFTAAVVLKLAAAGALDIDQPLTAYLPSPEFDARITLRMLLNQTSGLADYTDFPAASGWASGVSQQIVLAQIAQAAPHFAPGAAYEYSNSNYFVLGAVIEAVTSKSYASDLDAELLQPLGLHHTGVARPSDSASPYSRALVPNNLYDPSFTFSSGALWSNVSDLSNWDAALFGGLALPDSTFEAMTTPPDVPAFGQASPSNYAMGWARGQAAGGHPFAWHDGLTSSYSAFNGMLLDSGVSVVLLTNVPIADSRVLQQLAARILNGVCSSPANAGTC
jgi:D-alanyl-D-alanine carboxypeptidase